MKHYDVVIIGAGLLGCFVARNLAKYNWSIAVLEKNSDVCTEVSKANTAIIYPGYDNKYGTLKAGLCIQANQHFERLCTDLGVQYKKRGSMMVSFGPRGEQVLEVKYNQGQLNVIKGLRILETEEILRIEPNINKSVTRALYAEETATVDPWELGIAAYENAVSNGVSFYFESEVTGIRCVNKGYEISAGGQICSTRAVVNCAGLNAKRVSEFVNIPRFRLDFSIADYLLLDEQYNGYVKHIIMHEPEEKERGVTIVPTVNDNLLLGASKVATDSSDSFHTTREGCEAVREMSEFVFPDLPLESVIRSFATIRPAITIIDSDGNSTGERVRDFFIYETENPCFINLPGIRTPGLTCCDEIGSYVSSMVLDMLGNPGQNSDFKAVRAVDKCFKDMSFEERVKLSRVDGDYANIVCRCRKVTEGEIRAAIKRSPNYATVDGIKRRTGANMGRCQGGFCTQRIIELIAEENGNRISKIRKNECGSEMLGG